MAAIAIYEAMEQQKQPSSSHTTQAKKPSGSNVFKAKKFQGGSGGLKTAFNNRQSDVQIQGTGVVIKNLRDDLEGSRHQKFIIKDNTGQTVLIAHNIDLAPKIDSLREGDQVEFYGEYEWNDRGGIVHWTHRDPGGRHIGGWLKHKGKTYQ